MAKKEGSFTFFNFENSKNKFNKSKLFIILGIVIGIILISQIFNESSIIGKTVFDMWAALSISIEITTAAPNITTTAPTTATEDTEYIYDVNATRKDFIFSVNSSGLFGINSGTGLIRFTPRNGQDGSYNINVSVNDRDGKSDSQTYTLVISAVNDAPVLNPVGDLTGETGTSNTY